jgi:hypothetical protein
VRPWAGRAPIRAAFTAQRPAQQARDAEWTKAADPSPNALHWLNDYDAGVMETVAV